MPKLSQLNSNEERVQPERKDFEFTGRSLFQKSPMAMSQKLRS